MSWSHDVFRPLERFENLLASLYQAFAGRFESDPPASRLFAGLAKSSKTHQSQLEFVHRLAKSIENNLAEISFDFSRIAVESQAIERILGLMEHVSLEAAISQSIQFECSGAKQISRQVIGQAHPDLARMIRGFGLRRDAGNPALLMALAKERGFPIPPQVAAAAHAAIAAAGAAEEQVRGISEASKKLAEERAAEEARLEAAIKAGKTAIDFRLDETARNRRKE